MKIQREITPLTENDSFLVFNRKRKDFDFPIHYHPEFEINFIKGAKGGKRIIGDHIGVIDHYELVLVGSNIYHGWENFKNDCDGPLHEITIQFPNDLFAKKTLSLNVLKPIRDLLVLGNQGVLFSQETAKTLENKLNNLSGENLFENYVNFQILLNDLAMANQKTILTNVSFNEENHHISSPRINKVYNFLKSNYKRKIKIEEVANELNLSEVSLSRLIKKGTGKTFVEFTNELRLGYATRRLIETNESVSEICYNCGFNNISNFNRIFKEKQGCTPSKFRSSFNGSKQVI